MAAPLGKDEICIKGNKYRIVDTTQVAAQAETGEEIILEPEIEQQGVGGMMSDSTLELKVDKIIDILGDGTTNGGYRSVNITLPAREQKYPVMLGIHASQLHIRADQGLTLNMNSPSGEDIFIEVMEFPFSLSDLPRNAAIHTLYFTTGTNETNIKILAIGDV